MTSGRRARFADFSALRNRCLLYTFSGHRTGKSNAQRVVFTRVHRFKQKWRGGHGNAPRTWLDTPLPA